MSDNGHLKDGPNNTARKADPCPSRESLKPGAEAPLAALAGIFAGNTENPRQRIYEAFGSLGNLIKAQSISLYAENPQNPDGDFDFRRLILWENGADKAKENAHDLPPGFLKKVYAQRGTLTLSEDNAAEYGISQPEWQKSGLHNLTALPVLLDREGTGFIFLKNYDGDLYAKAAEIIQVLTGLAAGALKTMALLHVLSDIQNRDSLTKFKNRISLLDDLDNVMGQARNVGVLFVNINNLKSINADLGNKEGDAVIVRTGELLTRFVKNRDFVYRISGDEFVGLMPATEEHLFALITETLTAFLGSDESFTAALGSKWVASGKDLMAAITAAEEVMLEAKKAYFRSHPVTARYRQGKDFLLDILSPEKVEELVLGQNFFVVYQPKYDAQSEKVVGAEGLIRLRYNDTVIPPDEFIPTLDAAHYAYVVDLFVFESIAAKMRQRMNEGKKILPVSCNFSRHTLIRPDFIQRITAIMEHYKLPYDLIPLEVSERTNAIYHKELVDATIALAAHGFNLSIDDFGVAHANIWAHADLPESEVMFDKRLIDSLVQPNNFKIMTILNVMITLCSQMNVTTVAEGVESKNQLNVLKKLGCDIIQGYYFSKPVAEEAYYSLLD